MISKAKRPISIQGIIEALKGNFDQATAYRFVKILTKRGVIKQIDLRQNHAQFEMIDLKDHHHLICTDCGRIEDIHHCIASDMQGDILKQTKHFAEIRDHSLEFYGLCKSCAKKKTPT